MSEKFRPSNGTEGTLFTAEWCAQCRKAKRCRIPAATMAHDVTSPVYPTEWVRTSEGPACTAFRERESAEERAARECGERRKSLEEKGQLDLFAGGRG